MDLAELLKTSVDEISHIFFLSIIATAIGSFLCTELNWSKRWQSDIYKQYLPSSRLPCGQTSFPSKCPIVHICDHLRLIGGIPYIFTKCRCFLLHLVLQEHCQRRMVFWPQWLHDTNLAWPRRRWPVDAWHALCLRTREHCSSCVGCSFSSRRRLCKRDQKFLGYKVEQTCTYFNVTY